MKNQVKALNNYVILEKVAKEKTTKFETSTVEYEKFYKVVGGYYEEFVMCYEEPKEINGVLITKTENLCCAV